MFERATGGAAIEGLMLLPFYMLALAVVWIAASFLGVRAVTRLRRGTQTEKAPLLSGAGWLAASNLALIAATVVFFAATHRPPIPGPLSTQLLSAFAVLSVLALLQIAIVATYVVGVALVIRAGSERAPFHPSAGWLAAWVCIAMPLYIALLAAWFVTAPVS